MHQFTSTRKPHSDNVGYVSERKVKAPVGGHVVIYDREMGFDCDADYRWIVMHEPSGTHISVRSREMAYDVMKWAVNEPADALGGLEWGEWLQAVRS